MMTEESIHYYVNDLDKEAREFARLDKNRAERRAEKKKMRQAANEQQLKRSFSMMDIRFGSEKRLAAKQDKVWLAKKSRRR